MGEDIYSLCEWTLKKNLSQIPQVLIRTLQPPSLATSCGILVWSSNYFFHFFVSLSIRFTTKELEEKTLNYKPDKKEKEKKKNDEPILAQFPHWVSPVISLCKLSFTCFPYYSQRLSPFHFPSLFTALFPHPSTFPTSFLIRLKSFSRFIYHAPFA